MFFLFSIAFCVVGLIAGVFAGLLGIGGGVIFVPCQVLLYSLMGMPRELQIKVAMATSLTAIVFTTLSSATAHSRKKTVKWDLVFKIAAGLILGAVGGAFLGRIMMAKALEVIFGCAEILIGIYFIFLKTIHESTDDRLPNVFLLNLVGVCIGGISALLGMGGGVITVPVLTLFRVHLRSAIGSSAAFSFLISLAGAITYLYPSFGQGIHHDRLGYIELLSFIPMAVGSILGAPLGVLLCHLLPRRITKKIFALLLVVIGVLMIVR